MLGPAKVRCLDRPIAASIEGLVAADHFYRHLEAALDLAFVRDWVADCYAERGRPSIDPVVFFRLQLIMFFEGIRSERQLMRVVADRLSVRWYLGYDFDGSDPSVWLSRTFDTAGEVPSGALRCRAQRHGAESSRLEGADASS